MSACAVFVHYFSRCEPQFVLSGSCGHEGVLEVHYKTPDAAVLWQSPFRQLLPEAVEVPTMVGGARQNYTLEHGCQEVSSPPARVLYDAVLNRAIWLLLGKVVQRRNNELAMLFL